MTPDDAKPLDHAGNAWLDLAPGWLFARRCAHAVDNARLHQDTEQPADHGSRLSQRSATWTMRHTMPRTR